MHKCPKCGNTKRFYEMRECDGVKVEVEDDTEIEVVDWGNYWIGQVECVKCGHSFKTRIHASSFADTGEKEGKS